MILRRLFMLTALAVAASLCLGDRANAAYDVSTSITTVTGVPAISGLTLNSGPGSFVITGINGGTVVVTTGFTTFVDGGGSTIYLVNSNFTGFAGSLFTANEFVYANLAPGDTSSYTFTTQVKVTNPSLSSNTGAFTETATYTMSGGSGTGATPSLSTMTIVVGGLSFAIFNPQITSLTANSISNFGSVSAQLTAVPEPASVLTLGVGLVGVAGLGLRRMKRRVWLNKRL
jgi:hypothetical protein